MRFDRRAPGGGAELLCRLENGKALLEWTFHLEEESPSGEGAVLVRLEDSRGESVLESVQDLAEEEPLQAFLLQPRLWTGLGNPYLYHMEALLLDGGGVCQVSSCLYYCAVYSNLEIVKRACHAFSTGYIANGLDATIFYPSLDFKFRNNTGFPIKIVAYTEGNAWGKLTVQFYGSNPEGIYVKTERYTLSSTPWTTVYEPDETIERGTTKVDVTPYTGYEVDVYRCVYDANDNLISRTYENHSRYAKRDKKILYNPADEGPWGSAVDPGGQPSGEPIPEPTPDIPASMEPIPTPEPGPSMEPGPTDPWGIPSMEPSFPPEPTFPAYVDPVPSPEGTPEGGYDPIQDPWGG